MKRAMRIMVALALFCFPWLAGCKAAAPPAQLECRVEAASASDAERFEFDGKTLLLGPPRSFRVSEAKVVQTSSGKPSVFFRIHPDEAEQFKQWTAANLNSQIALLVDHRVAFANKLNTEFPGYGVIFPPPAGWTQEQAQALATRLAQSSSG